MEITYANKKVKAVCTNASEAEKQYGKKMAAKIHRHIDEITAAVSIEMLVQSRIGQCHKLQGNRKKQYAMHLEEPYRLVFVVLEGETQIARIQEITDYH